MRARKASFSFTRGSVPQVTEADPDGESGCRLSAPPDKEGHSIRSSYWPREHVRESMGTLGTVCPECRQLKRLFL